MWEDELNDNDLFMSMDIDKIELEKTQKESSTAEKIDWQKETRTHLDEADKNNNENRTLQQDTLAQVPQKYIKCLVKEFGHSQFRTAQWTIIKSIIEEKRDNCVIMSTGYGKSLTYQFPAIYLNKIAIVISPLISLMQDQVRSLNMMSEKACLLGSAQNQLNIYERIINLEFRLVYATPEYITSDSGLNMLKVLSSNNKLILIAVDEAHCISQWGHDFRFAYRKLHLLRHTVSHVPILALTATATRQVRDDICQQLNLRQPQLLCTGFDRPNLKFIVQQRASAKCASNVWQDLGNFIMWACNQQKGSAIVYCNTCNYAEAIAKELQLHIPCHYYHSKLSQKKKEQYHEEFSRDDVQLMVATMAFGMGIDKPDVRLVIHYGAPKNIEQYYQEVGRAGRDGLPAKCVLFYNSQDWLTHENIRQMSTVSNAKHNQHLDDLTAQMIAYIRTTTCRRKFILKHFGDNNTVCSSSLSSLSSSLPSLLSSSSALSPSSSSSSSLITSHEKQNCCDNCSRLVRNVDYRKIYDGLDDDGRLDITNDAALFLSLVQDLNGRLGLNKIIMILRGSRRQELPNHYFKHRLFGKGSKKSENWYKVLAENLQVLGYLNSMRKQSTFGSYSLLGVTNVAVKWLNKSDDQRVPIKIETYPEILRHLQLKLPENSLQANTRDEVDPKAHKTVDSERLLEALVRLRQRLATNLNVMPYMIASNIALNEIVKYKPKTMTELKACKLDGFYEAKYARFGMDILQCIQNYLNPEVMINKETQMEQSDNETSTKQKLIVPNLITSQNVTEEEESVNVNSKFDADCTSNSNELDLLLTDLEKFQNATQNEFNEQLQSASQINTSVSTIKAKTLMLRKKPTYEYLDSSEDTDNDNNDNAIQSSTTKSKSNNVKDDEILPQKVRKLPSWMLSKS